MLYNTGPFMARYFQFIMLMKNLLSFSFVVFGILFSCKEKDRDFNSTPILNSISLKPMKSGIHVFGVPNVKVIDGDLLILNLKDTLIFKLYNSELKYISGFGKLNELPLDLKFPKFSSQIITGEEEDFISIFDLANLNYFKFWPNKEFGSEIWDYEKYKLKGLTLYPTTILYLTDSTNVYVPEIGGALAIDNHRSNKSEIKPFSFKDFEFIKTENLPYVFQSVGAVNLDRNIILIAPILTGELEFYDLNGNFIKAITYDSTNQYGNMLREVNYLQTEVVINAVDLAITNDYIYLLSSNNKLNQHVTGIFVKNSSVYKLNWEGDLIQEYKLGLDASSLAVDEKNNRFYVTVNENDDEPIWYFEY